MPFNLYVLSIKVEIIVDALGRLVNELNSNQVNCLPERRRKQLLLKSLPDTFGRGAESFIEVF